MKFSGNISGTIPVFFLALTLQCLIGTAAHGQFGADVKPSETNEKIIRDRDYFHYSLTGDNLVEGIYYFRRSIQEAEEEEDYHRLSLCYNYLGLIHLLSRSFQSAEENFVQSFQIADKYGYPRDKIYITHNLLETFLFDQAYRKVDSIFPMAARISHDAQNHLYYQNLLIFINSKYHSGKFRILSEFTDSINNTLDEGGPKSWPDSIKKLHSREFKAFRLELDLFRGFAFTQQSAPETVDEGYRILLDPNLDSLEYLLGEDQFKYIKLSLLNYYRASYYRQQGDFETAFAYLDASDDNKYNALTRGIEKLAQMGDNVSELNEIESEVIHLSDINQKNKMILTFLILVLILVFLIIALLNYYLKKAKVSNKKIQVINDDLRKANLELRKVDEERFKFFSIVSHELKTPVYGITGVVDIVKTEKNCSPSMRENITTLEQISQYLSLLVSNILRVTSFDFSELKLNEEPYSLFELMEKIGKSIEIFARKKQITIQTVLDESLRNQTLIFDRVILDQVFLNLLQNALKHSNQGGKIEFHAETLDILPGKRMKVRFKIVDYGNGIPQDEIPHIFDAFKRGKSSNFEKGIGLGLFVVKENLAKYDSQVRVESELGIGTTFSFEIDFKIAPSPTLGDVYTSCPESSRPIAVLVVDDSELNLLVSCKNVKKIPNASCDMAISGFEAIEKVKQKKYDLILMDINMPEMDGFQATKEIRKIDPAVNTVALTALQPDQVAEDAKAVGMVQVLSKPFDFDHFKKTVLTHGIRKSHD